MLSDSVSEASAVNMRTSASGWGMEDPEVSVTGVHLRVLGGRTVWPLAFQQLAARDRRAFVEQRLEGRNFLAVPVGLRTVGGRFLAGILVGWMTEWFFTHMLAAEADCVLAALVLLHMRVKCVIPEELGGDYESQVSECGRGVCIVGAAQTAVTVLPDDVLGHGRDVGGVVRAPPVERVFRGECDGRVLRGHSGRGVWGG